MVSFVCRIGHRFCYLFLFVTITIIFYNSTTINYIARNYEKNSHVAYAHIFSDMQQKNATVTKNIGKYQIVFLPSPNILLANDNSTKLKFSLIENKMDVYNVFVSLIIKEKTTGNIVEEIPYKFYEFGDITFPYIFKKVGDYTITFQAKINGDQDYKTNPLVSSFDISVSSSEISPFVAWLVVLIPVMSAITGIIIYIDFSKRKMDNGRSNNTN